MTSTDHLLVVDSTNRVLHLTACPLLLTATAQLEPYSSLEHALIEGRLSLCTCVAIVVMRSTADFFGQVAFAADSPVARRLAHTLFRLVQVFDDQLKTGRDLHVEGEVAKH